MYIGICRGRWRKGLAQLKELIEVLTISTEEKAKFLHSSHVCAHR